MGMSWHIKDDSRPEQVVEVWGCCTGSTGFRMAATTGHFDNIHLSYGTSFELAEIIFGTRPPEDTTYLEFAPDIIIQSYRELPEEHREGLVRLAMNAKAQGKLVAAC